MNRQSVVSVVVAIAIAAGVGYWKYQRHEKPAEASLDGAITEKDSSTKPSDAQCLRYSEELVHHVAPDTKDSVRATKGGQEATCKQTFSVATLECIREHEEKNEVMSGLLDPYGCVTAHPRK